MKNYKDSDYALNKYSQGIVYKFADGIIEVTMEDYLRTNPGKTEQDFQELKALSDEINHRQAVVTNRTSRLNVTINGIEETEQLATASPDTELIYKNDAGQAMRAAKKLLDSGELTETQKRRFVKHFFKGMSTRQIAAGENVSHVAIHKSNMLAKNQKPKRY